MDGFDITLLTNQSILVPAYVSSNTVDLTGSVINVVPQGPAVVVVLCVNGQLVKGSTCQNTDRADTIHFAATSALGAPLTPTPTTGLLFTAIFNITGRSPGSQPVGFQAPVNDQNGNPLPECRSSTSVPGYCVTIANGSPTADPETVQSATFNNSDSATAPFVVLSGNATSFGPEFPSVSNHLNVTARGMNGFVINSTEPVQFTTITTPGLTVSPGIGSCASDPCSFVINLNTASAGDYSLTVSGTYSTRDSSGNPDTLVGTASLIVIVYDFGFTIGTTSLTLISGETGSTTATISSLNGFSGVVALSTRIVSPSGMTVAFIPSTVNVTSGTSVGSTITFTASPSAQTTYHVQVSAVSASRVKTSPTITVVVTTPVPDFFLFANPSTIGPVDIGVNATSVIEASFVNGFNSAVTLTVSSPSGVFASLNETVVTETHNVILTASSSQSGVYSITLSGSGGGITHTITVSLVVSTPSIFISAVPNSITTISHIAGQSTISVTPIAGFTGAVSLTSSVNPSTTLICSLTPSSINTQGTSTLSCTSASPGDFTVTVTGTSGTIVQTVTVSFMILASTDFALSANPSMVNTSPGAQGTSTISASPIGFFNGTVVLTSQAPSGIVCSLNPGLIIVSGTSTLSCAGSTGGYTVIVTGASGNLTHSVNVIFNIKPTSTAGLVCIASDGSTSCPVAPPTINSTITLPPRQLRVAVLVDSSAGLSGFDITLFADHTVLEPWKIDLTNSILMGNPVVFLECIGGQLKSSSGTCPGTDNADTIHLVATSFLGSPLTTAPTTGLLFTAIYNITGTTSATTIGFQTGCTNTSVAGVCVTIANGTPTPNPERVQTAIFTDIPTFSLTTVFPVGLVTLTPGSSSSIILNITSISGFSGDVTITSSISPPGPTLTVSPNNVLLNSTSPTGIANVTVSATASVVPGNYTLTITGLSGNISRSLLFAFIVTGPDFNITLNPPALAFDVGQSSSTTVTVTSLAGFAGTVTLTVVAPRGVTISSPASLNLTPNGSNASTLVIGTTNSTLAGTYTITVTGTSGATIRTATLTVNIGDFQVTIDPISVTLTAGGSGEFRVQLQSLNNFAGTVFLIPSESLNVSAALQFFLGGPIHGTIGITIGANQDFQLLLLTTVNTTATPGIYTVTLTATGPSATHTATVTVIVTTLTHDFLIVPQPSILIISQGESATSSLYLDRVNGFAGNVTLQATDTSNSLTISLNPSTLGPFSGNISLLTVIALVQGSSRFTPIGSYNLTVTAASGSLVHTATIAVIVIARPQPFFGITYSPEGISVPQGGSATSIMTFTSFYSFTGTISISNANSPIGLHATLSPSTVTVAVGGFGSAVLTVTAGNSVQPGNYGIVLTLTSGNLSEVSVADIAVLGPPPVAVVSVEPQTIANFSRTSGTVTFSVNVSNSPSFSAFQVILDYDTSVYSVASVDYAGNVLGPNTQLQRLCIDDIAQPGSIACQPPDATGVISISLYLLGNQSTPTPTNGLLFRVTFNIIGTGLGQVHIYSTLLAGLSPSGPGFFPASTQDGYFTNVDCPKGSGLACQPPTVSIQFSLPAPFLGSVTTFNATTIDHNANGQIVSYLWDWGDGTPSQVQTDLAQPIQHTFTINALGGVGSPCVAAGACQVTLTVRDSESVIWKTTFTVPIIIPSVLANGDFTVTADPISLTLQRGSSGTTQVLVVAENGFKGPVELGAAAFPQGLTVSFLNPPLVLGSLTAYTLDVTAGGSIQPGLYTITIGAFNGTIVHATTMEVTVTAPPPDFTITANPTTLTINAGSNSTSNISLLSLNGFSGSILLNVSISPSSVISPPVVTMEPNSVTLSSGGSVTSQMVITTSRMTSPISYMVTVSATNGTLVHSVFINVLVLPPPDIPPVANFTFTPTNPMVGQDVQFNGTSSFDPDGFVRLWTWNFGDGSGLFISTSPLLDHTFFDQGNFTVTLTVEDNAGLTGSRSEIVNVRPVPAHDVSILSVFPFTTVAVSTQRVTIEVAVKNNGADAENVSITVYANSHPVATLNGLNIQSCTLQGGNCSIVYIVEVSWDTTGTVPGTYTISATIFLPAGETDPTPRDNSLTDGTITVLPPPVIVAVPSSGIIGTKVTIEGSGFPVSSQGPFGPQFDIIQVTFDDMSLGFVTTTNGTFTFVLDVPQAQPGPHLIKAFDISGAHTNTSFQVLPAPGNVTVTVDTGAIYFPGDNVTVYLLTTLNGTRTAANSVKLTLVYPNGTITNLKTKSFLPGVYTSSFKVPSNGPTGTYSIVATAQIANAPNTSALSGFEVKPSWLSSHTSTIIGGTVTAGVLGLAGVAWSKGYFRRKSGDDHQETRNEGEKR